MARIGLAVLLAVLIGGGPLLAHHGYAEYDRTSPVALKGTIQNVEWVNPHILLLLETEEAGSYRVEWWSLQQMGQQGINASPLKAGDQVVITGSVNRNPEKRIVTLLREISRPSDGWRWADPRLQTRR